MKQSFALIISLFFILPLSQAQKVKWGPIQEKDGSYLSFYRVLGHDDNSYYLNMKPKKGSGTLVQYDYDHKKKKKEPIPFMNGAESLSPKSLIKTSSKVFALAYNHEKKNDLLQLFVAEFTDGVFGEPRKIYEQKSKNKSRGLSLNKDKNFGFLSDICMSRNKKYTAIKIPYSAKDDKKKNKTGIVLFDDNMELIWSKEQSFEDNDLKMTIHQIHVNDKGVIFLATSIWNKEEGKRNFKVYQITKTETSEIHIDIDGGTEICQMGLFENEDQNRVYLGGTLTEYGETYVDGVFFGYLDLSSMTVKAKTHEYSGKLLEQFENKEFWRKKILSSDYGIIKFISFDNNTFSFILEEEYSFSKSNNATLFHTDNIVIPKFDVEGELLEMEVIEKRFSSRMSEIMSHVSIPYKNKLYFVFSDKKSNEEKEELEEKGFKGGRYIDLCIIGENGKIEKRETLFTTDDVDGYLFTTNLNFSFGAEDKLILRLVRPGWKKYRFGTLFLE